MVFNKLFRIYETRNIWFLVSMVIIVAGICFGFYRFNQDKSVFNLGIDFAGGSTIMLKFEGSDTVPINQDFVGIVRRELEPLGLSTSSIVLTNNQEIIIKTILQDPDQLLPLRRFFDSAPASLGPSEFLGSDYIGPTIGAELKLQSFWIILSVCLFLLIYISWRFEFKFGLSALVALLHDASVVMAIAILFQFEINTAFVAAILTILGYSINDTIIIFDRIRENLVKYAESDHALSYLSNLSTSQTLVRSCNTSITTLLVILCLIVFGGTTIQGFCLVLFIGILSGTYSSIFIASPMFVLLKGNRISTELSTPPS